MDVALVTASRLSVPDDESPLLRDALVRRGRSVEIRAWDEPGSDWSSARCCVIRSTWNYPEHLDEFLAWTERVDAEASLWNPPAAIRANVHKGYLLDLEARGAPVVPTVLLAGESGARIDEVMADRGWEDAIVKPAVSLGGIGAIRVGDDRAAARRHLEAWLVRGDMLLQPFVASIADRGETSIVFVDGRPVQAHSKRPERGEFRVQEQYGGRAQPTPLDSDEVEVAARALSMGARGGRLLYGRVDLVWIDGRPHVMELELIEPSLFLTPDSPTLDALCDAIEQRL